MTSTAGAEPRGLRVMAALLFAGSAALTLAWSASMSAMPGMSMPGGWTMSMAWMRMPGQSWCGMAATFLGMWVAMMVAMMLPVLMPALWRYRPGRLAAIAGLGYFAVWSLLGVIAFPLGVLLAAAEMRLPELARAVPVAAGCTVLMAGALQLTQWKSRQLAGCRRASAAPTAGAGNAWRHGVRLGLRCIRCCAPLTAILFAAGVMDLRAMVLVTAAVTAERLLPGGERVARRMGILALAAGSIYLGALAISGAAITES